MRTHISWVLVFVIIMGGILFFFSSFIVAQAPEAQYVIVDDKNIYNSAPSMIQNIFEPALSPVSRPVIFGKQDKIFRMLVLGDMMLGRYVETLMNRYGDSYPFEKIAEDFGKYDLVVANLEGPIVTNAAHTPDFSTHFSFKPKIARIIHEQGIDAVTLANNHTYDYGADGFLDTIRYLNEESVLYTGHPIKFDMDYILEYDGPERKIVLFSFNDTFDTLAQTTAFSMVKNYAKDEDVFVIVVIHWGEEYQNIANDHQKSLAHLFIDNGVDVIVGHHPHVVQNIELYKDKIIFYSLGNFIFDQYFSEDTQKGLGVEIQLRKDKISYVLYPIKSIKSQPFFMNEDDTKQFLRNLSKNSSLELVGQIMHGMIVE